MIYAEMGEHTTWMSVAAFGISSALLAWNGWLTYLGAKLKNQSQLNKDGVREAKQDVQTAKKEVVAAKVESDRRDDKTDNRVDLLWQAHLRRGAAEAKEKELVVPKGAAVTDIALNPNRPEVRAAYERIAPFLREIRKRFPDPVAFTEEVESKHGDWLARHICEVLKVSDYACLAMALAVSEEPTQEHPKFVGTPEDSGELKSHCLSDEAKKQAKT